EDSRGFADATDGQLPRLRGAAGGGTGRPGAGARGPDRARRAADLRAGSLRALDAGAVDGRRVAGVLGELLADARPPRRGSDSRRAGRHLGASRRQDDLPAGPRQPVAKPVRAWPGPRRQHPAHRLRRLVGAVGRGAGSRAPARRHDRPPRGLPEAGAARGAEGPEGGPPLARRARVALAAHRGGRCALDGCGLLADGADPEQSSSVQSPRMGAGAAVLAGGDVDQGDGRDGGVGQPPDVQVQAGRGLQAVDNGPRVGKHDNPEQERMGRRSAGPREGRPGEYGPEASLGGAASRGAAVRPRREAAELGREDQPRAPCLRPGDRRRRPARRPLRGAARRGEGRREARRVAGLAARELRWQREDRAEVHAAAPGEDNPTDGKYARSDAFRDRAGDRKKIRV
ncbi:MAG: hypothetical protein AVDCRST_MAG02-1727, partial [uncultured Rubrobacteraceae bacterium]